MRMEFVSEKKVYCPTCGRSRGVVLWKETIKDYTCYYITCKHCHLMFRIENIGVWSGYV